MSETYGPTIPKDFGKQTVIGPALPPHLLTHSSKDNENYRDSGVSGDYQKIPETTAEADLTSSKSNSTPKKQLEQDYGPALPPGFQKVASQNNYNNESDEEYGPLPVGIPTTSLAQQALEERALQLKLRLLEGGKQTKSDVRENWMLELPEVGGAHLGLGTRQFRKNERPDFSDRSCWTDTPEQKAARALGKLPNVIDLKKEAELQEIAKRNKEKDKLVAEYNKKKKRDKSLVEMHVEKLKKMKNDTGETSTRRPFNRETDLNISQFDAAQKKSIMKNAMHLDDRFSRGQSKYL